MTPIHRVPADVRPFAARIVRGVRGGAVICACVLAMAGRAVAADAPVLTPEQEARAEALDHELVAPCCWTASVADHGSGQAPVVQADIRAKIAEGWSDDEIIAAYVERYGERILVEPSPKGFNRLAYWMTPIAVLVGLGLIATLRWRRSEPEPTAGTAADRPASSDPVRARIREEMERLDG